MEQKEDEMTESSELPALVGDSVQQGTQGTRATSEKAEEAVLARAQAQPVDREIGLTHPLDRPRQGAQINADLPRRDVSPGPLDQMAQHID